MRGGKKGSRKGRERVLVENEDDIIARNMMVSVLVYLLSILIMFLSYLNNVQHFHLLKQYIQDLALMA